MKSYCIFLFLTLSSSWYVTGQEETNSPQIDYDTMISSECNIYRNYAQSYLHIDEQKNGIIKSHYSDIYDEYNEPPQLEANFEKGVLNGPIKIYNFSGQIYCSGEMKSNRKNGEWKFYKNGKVAEQGEYDADRDSSFLQFDCDVFNFQSPGYYLYGLDTAIHTEFSTPGMIPWLNVASNRSVGRIGKWKFYDEDGNLSMIAHYFNPSKKQMPLKD